MSDAFLEEIQEINKTSLGFELLLMYLLIQPNDYVIDVGAAYGSFTPWLAKWCTPGLVEAIEPDNERVDKLIQICQPYGDRIKFHRVGASNQNKSGTLYMRCDGVNYDSKIDSFGLGHGGAIPIELKRLDSLLTRVPDFIKIDVEGAEELVIEGMGVLLNNQTTIMTEYVPATGQHYVDLGHPPYFLEMLYEKGFRIWVLSTILPNTLYVLPPEQFSAFTSISKKPWGHYENLVVMTEANFKLRLQSFIDQHLIQVIAWQPRVVP